MAPEMGDYKVRRKVLRRYTWRLQVSLMYKYNGCTSLVPNIYTKVVQAWCLTYIQRLYKLGA